MSAPLAGRRVVVTRPARQSGPLVERLTALGAEVVELPLIEIVPVEGGPETDAALGALERYDVIVVTSANGAAALGERLGRLGARIPDRVMVAAVGEATAHAMGGIGARVDLVPPRATGAAVAEALAERGVGGLHVLLARAREGRPELPERLRAAGAVVEDLALYETVQVRPEPARVDEALGADTDPIVVLTSPSTVASLVAAAGARRAAAVCAVTIGPTTSAAARAAGIAVAAEAREQSPDGLAAAVRDAAA